MRKTNVVKSGKKVIIVDFAEVRNFGNSLE